MDQALQKGKLLGYIEFFDEEEWTGTFFFKEDITAEQAVKMLVDFSASTYNKVYYE
jgi:hypothetical protein